MRHLMLILIHSSLVISLLAVSSHTTAESKLNANAGHGGHSPSELISFFDQYLEEYNNYLSSPQDDELTFSPAHFYSPTFQIPPKGKPRVAVEAKNLTPGLTQFLKGLQAEGIVRIEWRTMDIESLGFNKAIATNRAVGISADGKIQREMATIYFLHKEEGEWKIALLSPYSPKINLKFES